MLPDQWNEHWAGVTEPASSLLEIVIITSVQIVVLKKQFSFDNEEQCQKAPPETIGSVMPAGENMLPFSLVR